jgi:alpha-tubulin suppressor-like RCC1 family protein
VDSESTSAMLGVAHVSPSIWHACVVKAAGTVFCWGLNDRGQLGHTGGELSCMTTVGTVLPCNPKPTAVGLPGGVRVTQISTGPYYTCALTTMGDVYCWGANDMGQLGLPISTTSTPIPSRVAGLTRPAVQIAVATYANVSCALLDDATVWCWGQSALGGTGHDPAADPACGSTKCNPQPKVVADSQARPLGDVISIGVGRQVACAVTRAGSVYCWGANSLGTLGNGTADSAVHPAPQLVSGLSLVTALALGDETILATDSSGAVWGWGRNNLGSIGDGTMTGNGPVDGGGCTSTCKWRPTRANISNPQQLAIRNVTGIALMKDGSMSGWGFNATGELGHTPGTLGDVACINEFCNPQPTTIPFVPVR